MFEIFGRILEKSTDISSFIHLSRRKLVGLDQKKHCVKDVRVEIMGSLLFEPESVINS